jgi:SnoaL-like polyketide cyclase
MNKIILATFLISTLLISCSSQQAGPSEKTKMNIASMNGIDDAIQRKDFSKLGDFIAQNCVDHAGEHGDVVGLDSVKASLAGWVATVDQKMTVIKQLADDEYVMSWNQNTGKYLTEGQGHKVGDTFNLTGIDVVKFKDGKAVEHWLMMPPEDVVKMMSSTMAPPVSNTPVMPSDSPKMKKH